MNRSPFYFTMKAQSTHKRKISAGKPTGELRLLESGDIGSIPVLRTMVEEFIVNTQNDLRKILIKAHIFYVEICIKVGKGVNKKELTIRSSMNGIDRLVDAMKHHEENSPTLFAEYGKELFPNQSFLFKFLKDNKYSVAIENNNVQEKVTLNEDQWDQLINLLSFIID